MPCRWWPCLSRPSCCSPGSAGTPAQSRTFTKADYDNAAKFLGAGFNNNLVVGGSANVTWLPDERFWYRTTLADGTTPIVLVNPVAKTRVVCTPAIPECAGLGEAGAAGAAGGRHAADAVARGGRAGGGGGGGRAGGGAPVNMAPDGKKGVFIKDWNLWVRDIATGAERQLTKDGVENFGYATDNAGWTRSANAVVLWSPDSKKIATQQQDERNVGDMYMVNTAVGHPTLTRVEVPAAGRQGRRRWCTASSSTWTTGKVTRLLMPPDFHRATLGDNLSMNDYEWSPDGSKLALVSTTRVPQGRDVPRRGRRVRRGAHAVHRVGEDAVRIARELARALGHERDHLVLAARQLGPPLSATTSRRAS